MYSIDFFYDIISPYSFFAFEVFQRYIKLKKWNIEINWIPFYLGG